jgi:uncharacterized protein (DUF58 family)
LSGRGIITVGAAPLSALAGFLFGAEELVLLGLATAAFVVIGYVQCALRLVTVRDRWRVTVRLDATEVARGQPCLVTVGLRAEGGAGAVPVRMEDLGDAWQDVTGAPAALSPHRPSAPAFGHTLPVPAVGDDQQVSLRFSAPTGRRGIFHLGGVRLWCYDSLALFGALVVTGPAATITVLPIPSPVDLSTDLLLGRTDEEADLVTSSVTRRDNLGDFAGLRPYVPGDRLRLLHWPSLARTGDLMVRDFEPTGPRRVHLVADIRSHLGRRGAESVLSAMAGAGLAALAAGAIVEMSTTGGDRVAIGPGPYGDQALLRAVAAVAVERPPARRRRGRPAKSTTPVAPAPAPSFTRADLIITTPGGANSLPVAWQARHVVIAR